jgi:hypothetical protein
VSWCMQGVQLVPTPLGFRVNREVVQEPGFLAFLDPSRAQVHGIRPLHARFTPAHMQAKEAAGDATCGQGCEWSHSVSGYRNFQDTCATDSGKGR